MPSVGSPGIQPKGATAQKGTPDSPEVDWEPQDSLNLGNSTEELEHPSLEHPRLEHPRLEHLSREKLSLEHLSLEHLSLVGGAFLEWLSLSTLLGWVLPEPALSQGVLGLEAAVAGEEL